MRVLLGQLGSLGDCFYATVLARQIKRDFPDCHLTWAISSLCKSVVRNNPHVDTIWDLEVDSWTDQEALWYAFEEELLRRQSGRNPAFDQLILSQIWPNNFRNYDGTIRPSILRAYGGKISVPVETVISLDEEETERVESFRAKHHLDDFEHVVLFEAASKSGQSYVTPEFAMEVARKILERMPNICIIPSSHIPIESDRKEIVDGSSLSIRESAGLTHYCTQFVGCGSGLSVVATSGAAKPLPNIQLLKGSTSVYASFAHDFEYFGKPTDHFVEMHDADAGTVATVIERICVDGVAATRSSFGPRTDEISFDFYEKLIELWLLKRLKFADAARSTLVTAERYGWQPDLLKFARYKVAPNVLSDTTCRASEVRSEMEKYIDTVWTSV